MTDRMAAIIYGSLLFALAVSLFCGAVFGRRRTTFGDVFFGFLIALVAPTILGAATYYPVMLLFTHFPAVPWVICGIVFLSVAKKLFNLKQPSQKSTYSPRDRDPSGND